MNNSMVRYILGYALIIEAFLLMLPCAVASVYQEKEGIYYFATAILCIALGMLLSHKRPTNTIFYLKEGCIATSLTWILLSIFGCLPFWFSGEIPSFTDALFETVSGFTTTGASILDNVEALSHCSLLWRSFTNWVGGMGVLVFLLAVVPLSGGSHINLMRAESPGPSVGKLVPKVRQTARILYLIYIGMTVIEFLFLLAGKMPLFDALATSFSTAGTGGFGIKNDSFAGYSPYLQWVVTIFMILFGVNFNAYYLILFHRIKKAITMEELRTYFSIVIIAVAIITTDIIHSVGNLGTAIRHAAFQVGSLVTTTGFSTMDFDLWSQSSKTVLVLLMFVGACAGSTGGGMKVSRFVILIKTMGRELLSYVHPKSVRKIKMDQKPVEHEVVRSVNVYFITYVLIFVLSVFLLSIEGQDMTTNFTAITASINNIGPGLQKVGPSCNYGFFTDFSKYVLMVDMLAGRLELFPLLILFYPPVWKDLFTRRIRMHKASK